MNSHIRNIKVLTQIFPNLYFGKVKLNPRDTNITGNTWFELVNEYKVYLFNVVSLQYYRFIPGFNLFDIILVSYFLIIKLTRFTIWCLGSGSFYCFTYIPIRPVQTTHWIFWNIIQPSLKCHCIWMLWRYALFWLY